MTKKLLWLLASMAMAQASWAVPVRPGQTRWLTLAGGEKLLLELRGDEYLHVWQSADGRCFEECDGELVAIESSTLTSRINKVKQKSIRRIGERKDPNIFRGQRKGLVVMVEFADMPFQKLTPDYLKLMLNKESFRDGRFKGSVRDYFSEQSYGCFGLTFDVVGPVRLLSPYAYYGGNNDANASQMVVQAVNMIKNQVNWKQYDWDGDGTADQVFFLYAGHGEADYAQDPNTIWPHMSQVMPMDMGGIKMSTYACSCELNYKSQIAGIGTICHEFSHCMGFPDFYDTEYDNFYGMGSWDLMDRGSHNDEGYQPAGYTSYEKMTCGWLTPTALSSDVEITDMKPLTDYPEAYIMYNKANSNEYYLLENRQQKGFDSSLPAAGLLVTHVDYDQKLWSYGTPNSHNLGNDHPRMAVIPADNMATTGTQYGDAYPYNGNNRLTNSSSPAADLWNANDDDTKKMNYSLTMITQNEDGTVSFRMGTPAVAGDALFAESFNSCGGQGGNDGQFIDMDGWYGAGEFITDRQDWDFTGTSYTGGGAECARFGHAMDADVKVTTGSFTVNGSTLLRFKAAPFAEDNNDAVLTVTVNGTDTKKSFSLTAGKMYDYELQLSATGTVSITFACNGAFYLDDVIVTADEETGIALTPITQYPIPVIYHLSGTTAGSHFNNLPNGVYIINGKKILK